MTGGTTDRPIRQKAGQTAEFCTIADVAELLNVCQRTVRRWIARGELPHHRFGQLIRVSKNDLRSFVALRRQAS